MEVKVIIEKGLDGTLDVRTSDAPVDYMVLGQGKTINEAKADFFSCYDEIKRVYQKESKEFKELSGFIFHYDVPSFLKYYNQFISLTGLSKLAGINKAQLSHYIQGVRNPSPATTEKIQKALYKFADELKSIRLL